MLAVGFFMTGMGYFVASGELGLLFLFLILPLSFYGLFFIITVELPDFESDRQAQKMNLVVKLGRKNGKIISLITTVMGTIYFVLMLILETVNNLIDWTPIVFFSILPLLASIVSLLSKTNHRRVLIRRVMFNMTSLVLFVSLIDLSLLFQFIY
jgi:1,4-dihydroxy-2-naphthoate octaprenyltransferase